MENETSAGVASPPAPPVEEKQEQEDPRIAAMKAANADRSRKEGPKVKRSKVGGVIAAVANKNGIGKVVRTFPPVAMLSDDERAKATKMVKRITNKARKLREAAAPTPVPAPVSNGVTVRRGPGRPRKVAAVPAGETWARENTDPAYAEWQAWQEACAALRDAGAVTDADLSRPSHVTDVTPGTRALAAIRRWANARLVLAGGKPL